MNEQQYYERLKALHANHKKEILALYKEAALSNNPVKIGDTVSDCGHTIIVDQIMVNKSSYNNNMPNCYYIGVWLTKQGKPNKRGENVAVFQSNMTSHFPKSLQG